MTTLTIHWLRDERYSGTNAHASPQSATPGPLSPVCMTPNSTIGDERAEWVEAPYTPRCKECLAELARVLEEATTMPTAPVRVLITLSALVDPTTSSTPRAWWRRTPDGPRPSTVTSNPRSL